MATFIMAASGTRRPFLTHDSRPLAGPDLGSKRIGPGRRRGGAAVVPSAAMTTEPEARGADASRRLDVRPGGAAGARSSGGSSPTSTSSPRSSSSALFLDLLDTTIVNVALRTIGQEFQTEAIEWIVLGYTLSLAVWIPASGWLGDRFGTKRVFLIALALFVGGSVMCGLAQIDRAARGVPRRPGRRRRDAHADRHRHAVPGLPADRAGQGVDDRDDPDAGRAGARAGHRRRS